MILPSFLSGNVYVVDTLTNPKKPSLYKTIKGKEIVEKKGITYPHTTHCLANGDIMISYTGTRVFIVFKHNLRY